MADTDPLSTGHVSTGHGSGFCRITLDTDGHRLDLTVPSGVPLALLAPVLRGAAGGPADVAPTAWRLRHLDGRWVEPAETLAAAGVLDGALLFASAAAPEDLGPPDNADDPTEVIGRIAVTERWAAADTRVAALAAATAGSGLALVGMLWSSAPSPVWCLLVAAAMLAVATVTGRVWSDHVGAALGTVVAAAWAAAAAAIAVDGGSGALAGGGAAVLLTAGAARWLVRTSEAVTAALGAVGLLAVVGAATGLVPGTRAAGTAAVVAALALLTVGLLPSVAMRVAGVPRPAHAHTADGVAAIARSVDVPDLTRRVGRARTILTGLLVGCLLVTVVAVGVLGRSADSSSIGLMWVVVVLVLLRTRVFRQRAHVLVTVAGGLAAALAVLSPSLLPARPPGAVAVVAGSAVLVAVAATRVTGWRPSARLRRLADLGETTLQLAVVPLVLAVWGAFGAVLHLAG